MLHLSLLIPNGAFDPGLGMSIDYRLVIYISSLLKNLHCCHRLFSLSLIRSFMKESFRHYHLWQFSFFWETFLVQEEQVSHFIILIPLLSLVDRSTYLDRLFVIADRKNLYQEPAVYPHSFWPDWIICCRLFGVSFVRVFSKWQLCWESCWDSER